MNESGAMRSRGEHSSGDNSDTCGDRITLIDLHCHIIPGVDDGARNDEQALHMLRAAEEDGISTIVATPHAGHATREQIEAGVEHITRLAEEADINIRVLAGCEIRIGADLVQRIEANELLTLNGTRYALLELYLAHSWAMDTVELVVDRLLDAGIVPILAHVERYPTVQKDLTSITGLLERGVPMQVNAPSLTGYHGPAAQTVAEQLARAGHLDILASDAHNDARRAPRLAEAFQRLQELAGSEHAGRAAENARRVIANEEVLRASADAIR